MAAANSLMQVAKLEASCTQSVVLNHKPVHFASSKVTVRLAGVRESTESRIRNRGRNVRLSRTSARVPSQRTTYLAIRDSTTKRSGPHRYEIRTFAGEHVDCIAPRLGNQEKTFFSCADGKIPRKLLVRVQAVSEGAPRAAAEALPPQNRDLSSDLDLDLDLDLAESEFAERWSRGSRRIAVFVEPSPFSYICGYKNRFQNFIRYLREMGDEVLVVTTDQGVPDEFYGAKVIGSLSFPLPWYPILPMSVGIGPRIWSQLRQFKPEIIHSTSPGFMCFGALLLAKLLSVPLVFSYHTHIPAYIPKYTFAFLVTPMWWIIQFLHRAANVTLTTSHALAKELTQWRASTGPVRVWQKGVDSDLFHPRHKSLEARARLSDGEVDKPLIVHVGRIGAEKNLDLLVEIMNKLPDVRLAIVGDGPFRPQLESLLSGVSSRVVFTGMLQGEELSAAYASGDVFITPSESETLGFVVLEAMASGVPVVAARAGGIPDIVSRDGVNGLLFNPGDTDDAVAKLKSLLASPSLREKMAVEARKEVELYDWRASTKSVRNVCYGAAVQAFEKRKRAFWSWLPLFQRKKAPVGSTP